MCMTVEALGQQGEHVQAVIVKPEAAALVGFNLQDNGQCLPLSGPCKSNWRRHYSAVIGSFVHEGGLSKLISQLGEKLLTPWTAKQWAWY